MTPSFRWSSLFALALLGPTTFAACAHEGASPGTATAGPPPCSFASANDGTQSYDLLCRDPVANHAKVKHILLGWRELATPDRPQDPRATARTQAAAQELARDLLQKIRAGAPIEPLMAEYSEDPGSAQDGRAYDASPDASLVSEFKSLSLRLQVGEAGIVRTGFGLHIIKRVQ